MEKILVPVDGSGASRRAVEFVVQHWAQADEVHIHLVNVQEPPPAEVALEAGMTPADWQAEHQKAGHEVMDPACKALTAAGLRFTATVCVGHPAEQIATRANELECSQIVMGTRGLSALASLVLGSVATRVIHAARCPVTLVK
jgi:nucleotide-binding universal stress UspA family protein